jgi:hypothetical protein
MGWVNFKRPKKGTPSSRQRRQHSPVPFRESQGTSNDPPTMDGYTVEELTQDQLDAALEQHCRDRR